ncbi:DoxX-like family protein [Flammeovirga kamogawensis]|uniref:EpsG family protein n=1 Tax=Flammeovirga kamogawensis TaxID=373891 RepID=A0ABX8H4A7_9BACT|nr:DoxX-like family protein [Flammeovirga kamogawensis]MBB6460437.1 hypothetical protein [Flammeovirga kamogawensis]QWG10242.1 hypothetical protein KM029_21405 [Flammeovirga kamogawensis]TRX64691.1 hypothetical protein EO216_19330 [Flammeovirga kamogawensis]
MKSKIYLYLSISTFCVFIGRATQHLVWDAPFRTLLWDEGLLKGFVENIMGYDWFNYVTSPTTDTWINGSITAFGILYLLAALSVFVLHKEGILKQIGLKLQIFGALGLMFLAFLYSKEKFMQLGQLLEYSAQFTAPLLLWYVITYKEERFPLIFAKVVIALTFICHGLYAVGFYPVPGKFVDMTIATIGVTESTAKTLLLVAGIMDFIVAIGIFIPRIAKPMLIYMVVWGTLTSMARLTGHFHIEFLGNTLLQWLPAVIYRVPHALLPLIILQYLKEYEGSQSLNLREKIPYLIRKVEIVK